MRKIDHNSANLYQIPNRIGTEMHLISPSCVSSFSLIGVCVSKLWLKMQSVRNEEKNEEIILKLCSLESWDWLTRFASNLKYRFA